MLRTNLELEDIKDVANSNINWNKLKNKILLISGATGFIGSYLCDVIRYRNDKFNDNIKIISLTRRGEESDASVKYVKCDINEEIELDENVDFILHLASNTHPKQYKEDPVGTITTNILGCLNLLNYGKKHNIDRFLLASSVEIYGDCIDKPVNEDYSGYIDCNNARSGYNESKRLCESLCQSYKSQYGLDFVTARLSRIIGPDRKEDTKAISQFIGKALANENIVLKSKGNQLYSYCYVTDAVYGILKILTDGESANAYNIAAEIDNMTLGDYARFIANLAGMNVIFDIENNASVSKATYALLDNSKIKKLGWYPKYTVKEGLTKTYNVKKILMDGNV